MRVRVPATFGVQALESIERCSVMISKQIAAYCPVVRRIDLGRAGVVAGGRSAFHPCPPFMRAPRAQPRSADRLPGASDWAISAPLEVHELGLASPFSSDFRRLAVPDDIHQFESTPWRAVEQAAWQALHRPERRPGWQRSADALPKTGV